MPVPRRAVLIGAVGALGTGCAPATTPPPPAAPDPGLTAIEQRFGGRIGVVARDTGSDASVDHRRDERVLMCSTVKVPIVAAVLRRAESEPGLLERRIPYGPGDLLEYAPVTRARVATGMTVAELCDAALTVSDNTAANLLVTLLGGPAATTAFLRTLGDRTSRSDRVEPALNDLAGDQDTTTPATVARDLEILVLGPALAPASRDRLTGWMLANTTGAAQIRAGVPAGWRVADKTGSGSAGESHDVGVLRPPTGAPIVLAVYTTPPTPDVATGKATIAEITRTVIGMLGR